MRVNKTISLDIDVGRELSKQHNQSGLIEQLLKDYFKLGYCSKVLEKKNQQILKLQDKITELSDGKSV